MTVNENDNFLFVRTDFKFTNTGHYTSWRSDNLIPSLEQERLDVIIPTNHGSYGDIVKTGSTLRLCCVAQDKTTKKLYFFINQVVSKNKTALWYKYHSALPNELKQEIQRIKEILSNKDSFEIFDF